MRAATEARADLRTYKYDSLGRLAQVTAHDPDGSDWVAETYSYNADGSMTHTRYLEPGATNDSLWQVEGTDAAFPGFGAVAVTTFFDSSDRPTKTLFIDKEQRVVNTVVLYYDPSGHLVEEQAVGDAQVSTRSAPMFVANGVTTIMRRLFKYDDAGRKIEVLIPCEPLGFGRTVIRYNDYGDEVLRTLHDDDRSHDASAVTAKGIVSSVLVRESSSRLRYHYDGNGNWVQRLVEGRIDPDAEWFVETVESRLITYYK
jgi:hypothetical protein